MPDPTFPVGDNWAAQPNPVVAAARVAYQDRLLRSVVDRLESDIREQLNQQDANLAAIYEPRIQERMDAVAGAKRIINGIQSRLANSATAAVRINGAGLESVGQSLGYDSTIDSPSNMGATNASEESLPFASNNTEQPLSDAENTKGVGDQNIGNESYDQPISDERTPTTSPVNGVEGTIPSDDNSLMPQEENVGGWGPPTQPPPASVVNCSTTVDETTPAGTVLSFELSDRRYDSYDGANVPLPAGSVPSRWAGMNASPQNPCPQGTLDGHLLFRARGKIYITYLECGNVPVPPGRNAGQITLYNGNGQSGTKLIQEFDATEYAEFKRRCAAGEQPSQSCPPTQTPSMCKLPDGTPGEHTTPTPSCPPGRTLPRVDTSQLINWNDPDVCAAMERYQTQGPPQGVIGDLLEDMRSQWPQNVQQPTTNWLTDQLTQERSNSPADQSIPGYMQPLLSIFSPSATQMVQAAVSSAGSLLEQYRQPHPSAVGCSPNVGSPEGIDRLIKGLVNNVSRGGIEPVIRAMDYVRNYGCPNEIPGQPGIDLLRITDYIDLATWTCLTRALGHTPHWHDLIVKASYTKPNVLETIAAWRRGEIKSETELDNRLKKLGVADDTHRKEFKKITEALPGMSDILRFLVRDVADTDLVNKFKLDGIDESHFDKKWRGELIKYAEAQGIPIEVARYAWRAHWDVPARTHANEFLQRLRKDMDGNPRDPSGVVVDRKDIETLYTQNDMAPYWVPMYLATSYHPLGRIDIRRAYDLGAFGKPLGKKGFEGEPGGEIRPIGKAEKELVERHRDIAYNDRDSIVQAYAHAKDYDRRKNGKGLQQAKNMICESVGIGGISADDAYQDLLDLGETEESATRFIDLCRSRHALKMLKAYMSATRKLYLVGEIDDDDVRGMLSNQGMESINIEERLELWRIERAARAKFETPAMLCQQYNFGVISAEMMRERLQRLQYSDVVAERIVRTCIAGKLARDAKERRAAERMARAEAQRQQNQRNRELERLQREMEQRSRSALSLRTETNLAQWLREGIVNEDFIRQTFAAQGRSRDDAERWLAANRD